MKKLFVTLASLGLMSSAAYAATNPVKDSTNQQGHPYVSVQLGFGGIQTGTTLLPDSDDGSKAEVGGLAYRLSGGYLFKINNQFQIGPELGYMSYAKNNYQLQTGPNSYSDAFTYSGNTIDLLAKAVYNFDNSFSLFGKFGFALVRQTFKVADIPQTQVSVSDTESAILPELALGLGYNFTPQIGMSASLNTTFGGTKVNPLGDNGNATADESAKVANVSTLMMGLNYSF